MKYCTGSYEMHSEYFGPQSAKIQVKAITSERNLKNTQSALLRRCAVAAD